MTNSRSLITRFALPLVATALVLTACGSTTASTETAAPAAESAMASEEMAASDEMAESDEMGESDAMASEGHSDDSSGEEMGESDAMASESSAGAYINLKDYEGSKEMYDAGKVVLFFNASWCSTCKEARENLEADPAAIPAGLTIVKVDYDDSDELKQKYGVTVQHTFVQVDADGNEIAKWNGSVTADQIAEQTA